MIYFVHFDTLCCQKQSVQVHAAVANKMYMYILFYVSIANPGQDSVPDSVMII